MRSVFQVKDGGKFNGFDATSNQMCCQMWIYWYFVGALFANIYLVEAVCRLGGATVFNNIYHQTRPIYKGMVFFVMASFPLCAAILMMQVDNIYNLSIINACLCSIMNNCASEYVVWNVVTKVCLCLTITTYMYIVFIFEFE